MKIKTHLKWREVTPDGLMKRPEPVGPHYSEETLDGSYESKEEAIEALEFYYGSGGFGSMVLIEVYSEDWGE